MANIEIVARGVVTGIRMGEPIGSPITCVAKAQGRCPRCHGEDLSGAIACPRCGILSHSECQPCCSYNCGPLFTRTGTGLNETDWQGAPEGWRVTVVRYVRDPVHGPVQQQYRRQWRTDYSRKVNGEFLRVEECILEPVSYYITNTWQRFGLEDYRRPIETVYHATMWRVNPQSIPEIDLYCPENEEEPDDAVTYFLTTTDRLEDSYRDYLADSIDEYVDTHWLAEVASEAFASGGTVDFGALREQEIEDRLENADTEELVQNAFGTHEYEEDPELSEGIAEALGLTQFQTVVLVEEQ